MEQHQHPCIKTKKVIDIREGSKTLNEVKPAGNIINNPEGFLEKRPVQKEILLSEKLKDHVYE